VDTKQINHFITLPKIVFKAIRRKLKKDPDSFLHHVSGVIHVGANTGQERELYAKHNLDVLWIEPIPEIFEELKNNLKEYPRQQAYKYLVTDRDNKSYEFHVANNNGASSSLLNLDLHKDIWPQIHYERSIIIKSLTLASLVENEDINMEIYDALVMDTQGSELLVLQGAEPLLRRFKYIKTEASDFECYTGCCQLKDIENFLFKHGYREYSRNHFASRKEGGKCYDVVYIQIE
jgi:FkbM family methyltransferase